MFKIMIVEDSDIFRQTMVNSLREKLTYSVEEARNGSEAILKTRLFLPNLIFMDVKLPDSSGLEVTREIKTTNPDITIIVITNYDFPEYRDKAIESGADFFLSKASLTEDKMIKLIENVISEHQSC